MSESKEEDVRKIMQIRESQRERGKRNYHKRKENGTLKKYYIKTTTPNNIKAPPTIEEMEQLKYLKPKKSTKEMIKVNSVEFEMLKAAAAELKLLKE